MVCEKCNTVFGRRHSKLLCFVGYPVAKTVGSRTYLSNGKTATLISRLSANCRLAQSHTKVSCFDLINRYIIKTSFHTNEKAVKRSNRFRKKKKNIFQTILKEDKTNHDIFLFIKLKQCSKKICSNKHCKINDCCNIVFYTAVSSQLTLCLICRLYLLKSQEYSQFWFALLIIIFPWNIQENLEFCGFS